MIKTLLAEFHELNREANRVSYKMIEADDEEYALLEQELEHLEYEIEAKEMQIKALEEEYEEYFKYLKEAGDYE
jgi:predicted  nucleic acid-binding Zn-ribbon protein